ncbi:MAG TPA: DUF3617 domain-containing protein [Rhizomicrobium sp.]|jgi:hypothetical protein
MRLMLAAAVLLCAIPFAASAQQVQPGQWTYSSKITHIEGDHVPPGMAQALASEPPNTDTKCLTAAEAAHGLENMLKEKDKECTLTSNAFAGGVLDATRSCKSASGTNIVHLHGPVTPTGFTLNATGTSGRGIKIDMVFTAKRVGACK